MVPYTHLGAGCLRPVTGVGVRTSEGGREEGGGAEVDFSIHLHGWNRLKTSDPRALGWKYCLHGQNSLGNCQKFPLCCADTIKR